VGVELGGRGPPCGKEKTEEKKALHRHYITGVSQKMLPLYSEGISFTRPVYKRVKVPKVVVESAEVFDERLMGGAFFREDVVFGGRSCPLEGEALPSSDTLTCPQLLSEECRTASTWEQEMPPMRQLINEVLGPPWWSGDDMHMPRIAVPTAGLLEIDTQVELVQAHVIRPGDSHPGDSRSLLQLRARIRSWPDLPKALEAQIQAQSESKKIPQQAMCSGIESSEPITEAHIAATLASTWPWRGDRIYPLTGINTSDAPQILSVFLAMPLRAMTDIGVRAAGCVIGSDIEASDREVFKQVRAMCTREPDAISERPKEDDKIQLKYWPRVQLDPSCRISFARGSVQLEQVSPAICRVLSAHLKVMTPLSRPQAHESVSGSMAGVPHGAFIPMHKPYRAPEALVSIVSSKCPMRMITLPPPDPLILTVPPDTLETCEHSLKHMMEDEQYVLMPQAERNIMLHSMRLEYLRLHLPNTRQCTDKSQDAHPLLGGELDVTCAATEMEVEVEAEVEVETNNTERVQKRTFPEISAVAVPTPAAAPHLRVQVVPQMPFPPPPIPTTTGNTDSGLSFEREGQIPLLELFRQIRQGLDSEPPIAMPIPVEEDCREEADASGVSSKSHSLLPAVRWQEEQPWYSIDKTPLERTSSAEHQQPMPHTLLRPLPPTVIEEAGLQVLVSEAQFEASPWLVTELARSHGIHCIDVQLEEPLALVVDGHTGVALLSHDMGADRAMLKQTVKALTRVAFKFRVIWLLVVQVSGTVPASFADDQNQQEKLTYASGYYKGLCQSLSQFPCRVVLRHCTSELLAEQVAAVCADAQEEAQIGFNVSSAEYLHRPLFAALERGQAVASGIECISSSSGHSTATVLPQHCQFLQLLPTINFYAAAELLTCWPLYRLVALSADEIIALAPLRLPNPHAILDMCALLGRHIGMRCDTRRIIPEHGYEHAPPVPAPPSQVRQRLAPQAPTAQVSPTAAAWAKPGARHSPPVRKAGLKGPGGRPLQYFLPPGATETQTKLVFR